MTTKPKTIKVEENYRGFESYKRRVEHLLRNAGWSVRGVFKAFVAFKIAEAYAGGESPESFASRVDSDAPLGMAS